MATGATDIPKSLYEVIWNYPTIDSTGSFQFRGDSDDLISLFNSDVNNLSIDNNSWNQQRIFQNENKKFIKLHNYFNQQYAQLIQYYNAVSENKIREGLSIALSNLFDLTPDSLSLQLTYEQSIFFTFQKGNNTIYFELFFDAETDETDETVITIFEGDKSTLNYAGTLTESLEFLKNYLLPSKTI